MKHWTLVFNFLINVLVKGITLYFLKWNSLFFLIFLPPSLCEFASTSLAWLALCCKVYFSLRLSWFCTNSLLLLSRRNQPSASDHQSSSHSFLAARFSQTHLFRIKYKRILLIHLFTNFLLSGSLWSHRTFWIGRPHHLLWMCMANPLQIRFCRLKA